jgi:hypothetical protein
VGQMDPHAQSQYLIDKAEECFRLARQLRSDLLADRIADELDTLGHDLMARAVAIDTDRDRAQTRRDN